MQRFLRDFSFSAAFAGLLAVVVAFAASGITLFEAARSIGAQGPEIASWVWAICVSGGLISIVLSIRYRIPVIIIWSTPGAALLIASSSAGASMPDAIGAFIVCALLMIVFGFMGWFERAIKYIPIPLAAGMLAGILLRFGLNVFTSMQLHLALVATMLAVWLVARCSSARRYAVLISLAAGVGIAIYQKNLHLLSLQFGWTHPIFIVPHFSWAAIVGIAIPLFVVTMASQQLPGIAVLQSDGHNDIPISSLTGWGGIANLLFAPFGAYALALAANTAAICTGPEAHEHQHRRYVASVFCGFFYIVVGIFGTALTRLLESLPRELIFATAGIALFGTLGNAFATAMLANEDREAALITFLVTASGLTLWGIGSSFWALIIGLIVLGLSRLKTVTIGLSTK